MDQQWTPVWPQHLFKEVVEKPKNGYIAEENRQGSHASMASIGG